MSEQTKDAPFESGETLFLRQPGLPSVYDWCVTFEAYDGDDFALIKFVSPVTATSSVRRVPVKDLRRAMPVW
jgi:hypothetical protein